MEPIDLNLLRAFVAVHETASFTRAAARLATPRSTVSRAIAELEASLGVALFVRTTRTVVPTPAGLALHERVAPALQTLLGSLTDLPAAQEAPSGLLRVTSTPDLGSIVLAEAVARYVTRHPGTRVELLLTTGVVDLARDGVDLALRVAATGTLAPSSLVARPVGAIAFALYAAPSYLARRGTPRTPADLDGHDLIGFRGMPPLTVGAALLDGAGPPRVVCDDTFCARELARHGAGLAPLPTFLGDVETASGALVRVLPRWVALAGRAFLVRPARKHVPPAVTAFRDILLDLLRRRPLVVPDAAEDVASTV